MSLKKKVIDQRVELLKLICHEVRRSEKGNWWGIPMAEQIGVTKKIFMNERSLRKGNFFSNYGEFREIPVSNTVIMVTKTGGLKIKDKLSNHFKNITRKNFRRNYFSLSNDTRETFKEKLKLAGMDENMDYMDCCWRFFYKGKKSEWISQKMICADYEFFRSFNSFKEAKNFLKYPFIGEKEFYNTLKDNSSSSLIFYAAQLEDEDRIALFHHLKTGRGRYLYDMFNMWKQARENNVELDPFRIPTNHEQLRQVHDDLTYAFNESKALGYSDKPYIIDTPLIDKFKEEKLIFKLLDSPREVYKAGCRSHHCIATRTSFMDRDIFFSFEWEGESYDCQMKNEKIYEFRGYRNKNVPDTLRQKVQNCMTECLETELENAQNEGREVNPLWKVSIEGQIFKPNTISGERQLVANEVQNILAGDELPF